MGTVGEVRTNSKAKFLNGILHVNTPVLTDKQKSKFTSSVQILAAV